MTILFVGRLIELKSVADLIDAFGTTERPDWRLKIVGDGALRVALQDRAVVDSRVEFVGSVEYDQLDRHYRTADVLVLPSAYEAWGLVVNEALAFGLRVIVSDRVGSRHILGPRDSVFPYGDVARLATEIERSDQFLDRLPVPPFDASTAMAADLRRMRVR